MCRKRNFYHFRFIAIFNEIKMSFRVPDIQKGGDEDNNRTALHTHPKKLLQLDMPTIT